VTSNIDLVADGIGDIADGAQWICLSDHESPNRGNTLIDRGLMVIECVLPVGGGTVLLGHHSDAGWHRAFSVFHDPMAGIMILHRQGNTVTRHALPGPLPTGHGTARISFAWDAPARRWRLDLEIIDSDDHASAEGRNPLPMPFDDLAALCRRATGTVQHPGVLWFGITRSATLPGTAPWIGINTPIPTTRGIVPAGSLKPGDMIETVDNGPLPLLHLRHGVTPGRGTFAPVLLRAPYFCRSQDLLVAADQLVLYGGAEVEYLFGEEEVLIPAACLVDGQLALREHRRAVLRGVTLDLGMSELVSAGGCQLSTLQTPSAILPRRVLDRFETIPLLSLLGSRKQRIAV
jgi:hypothetical protein